MCWPMRTAFCFLMDGDTYHGFCHGAYFNTFWLSGMTCYVSSIITNEDERGKGCGVKLMDHAKGTGQGQRLQGPWCWTPVCPGPRPTGSMRSTDLKKAATALTIIWSRKRGNLPRKTGTSAREVPVFRFHTGFSRCTLQKKIL